MGARYPSRSLHVWNRRYRRGFPWRRRWRGGERDRHGRGVSESRHFERTSSRLALRSGCRSLVARCSRPGRPLSGPALGRGSCVSRWSRCARAGSRLEPSADVWAARTRLQPRGRRSLANSSALRRRAPRPGSPSPCHDLPDSDTTPQEPTAQLKGRRLPEFQGVRWLHIIVPIDQNRPGSCVGFDFPKDHRPAGCGKNAGRNAREGIVLQSRNTLL